MRKLHLYSSLGLAALAALAFTPASQAWTVQYLDTLGNPGASSAFAEQAPTITVVVDVNTGNVKLVGSAGAIMNQYRIYSSSGALIKDNMNDLFSHHDEISGMENYRAWMYMYGASNPDVDGRYLALGDKCCPMNDPLQLGVVYFDRLENNTLDLGNIWDVSMTTSITDLTFTFSYGYVKKESQGDLNSIASNYNFLTGTGNAIDENGDGIKDGDGQIMLQNSYSRPDGLDVNSLIGATDPYASFFPNGDGVSAFGTLVFVPEPASLICLAGGFITACLKKGKKNVR